jgi:hypothetical protein
MAAKVLLLFRWETAVSASVRLALLQRRQDLGKNVYE